MLEGEVGVAMRMGKHGRGLAAGTTALLCAACGGRSDLLEPFQSEISSRAGAGAGGGGANTFGGRGGTVNQGGTFATGGSAGTPSISGMPGTAGNGQAGETSTCLLSVLDCATKNEPECEGSRQPCTGRIDGFERLDTTQYSYIADIASGRDDRVAVTGYHVGMTAFGPLVITSEPTPTQPHGQRAYVASFDRDEAIEWVTPDDGAVESHGVSLALAPNGDTLLETQHIYSNTTGASLIRLSALGEELWRIDWGTAGTLTQRGLAVDNDDRSWLGGNVQGPLEYPPITLGAAGRADGYLIQVDDQGEPLRAMLLTPEPLTRSEVSNLVVDDEDSVLVVGAAWNDHGDYINMLRKFSAGGELLVERNFGRTLVLGHVVVDRLMRFTLVGSFSGTFENEGERFQTVSSALWVAQYSRDGDFLWQKTYGGRASVTAATVDPSGNIIVVGRGPQLTVGKEVLMPDQDGDFAFALKLRPDGTDVWVRKIDGSARFPGATTDSTGTVWLAGTFSDRVWLGDNEQSSSSDTGLLVRLSP